MKNALVILAGGEGKRIKSSKIPKQFIQINSQNLIEYFLNNLDPNIFNIIKIVVKKNFKKKYLSNLKKKFNYHKISFVESGKFRQGSSKNGLLSLKKMNPEKVLIHDAARPLVSNILIKKILNKLDKYEACTPYIKQNDLIKKRLSKEFFDISLLMHIQTPQGFRYKSILKAHKLNRFIDCKDDTTLTESIGISTKFIKGDKFNIKITYKEDIDLFQKLKKNESRYGIGYDIHKINYQSKKKLKLCGVKINHPSLISHSDGDVGYHAICDSILGALGFKDIGHYFKIDDIRWKNADSKIFMQFCNKKLEINKFKIINLDINFICETPKINKFINKMKNNISEILNIKKNRIAIKATTNEKIGFIGKGEGIAAESIVLIQNE